MNLGNDTPEVVIHPDSVPLRVDEDGDIRVAGTGVLFDFVVGAFEDGSTPEQIVQMYTTLGLAEVYSAIGYYLRHQEEVRAYMRRREEKGDELRRQIEAHQGDMGDIRARLLARRA